MSCSFRGQQPRQRNSECGDSVAAAFPACLRGSEQESCGPEHAGRVGTARENFRGAALQEVRFLLRDRSRWVA